MNAPDPRFTALYIASIATFVGTELIAIHNRKGGQTFTSQTRWLEQHVPAPLRWGLRVAILGIATWAGVHLAEGLA